VNKLINLLLCRSNHFDKKCLIQNDKATVQLVTHVVVEKNDARKQNMVDM